jgi:hypothetical protein
MEACYWALRIFVTWKLLHVPDIEATRASNLSVTEERNVTKTKCD